MEAEQREIAAEAMRDLDIDERWLAAIEPDSPKWLFELMRRWIDIYQRGDVEALLAQSNPEMQITQPSEFPDRRTYEGLEGVVESLLDWPQEWETFSVEPKRIFAVGDRAVADTIHRGRSRRMGIDVEAQIVWVFDFDEARRTSRFDMFLSLDQALRAAETQ